MQAKEKFSLKDELFNPKKVHQIASEIKAVHEAFEQEKLEVEVTEKFPTLELKERIAHIGEMIYLVSMWRRRTSC